MSICFFKKYFATFENFFHTVRGRLDEALRGPRRRAARGRQGCAHLRGGIRFHLQLDGCVGELLNCNLWRGLPSPRLFLPLLIIYFFVVDQTIQYICPLHPQGNLAWASQLDWSGAEAFSAAPNTTWTTSAGGDAGTFKSASNFTFLKVSDAGHMVPRDQPFNSLDMVRKHTTGFWGAGAAMGAASPS